MDPSFYNNDQPTQGMVDVIKARGIHDLAVRRNMLEHCKRGRLDAMRHATAQFLIDDGLARSEIPAPALPHLTSPDLRARLEEAVRRIAMSYTHSGGIITARGYWKTSDLTKYMLRLWAMRAPKEIAKTEALPTYEQKAERIARTSVAAQRVRQILWEKHNTLDPANPGYHISEQDLEGFCLSVVKEVYRVWNAPDEWVHEQLHGEDSG